MSRRSSKYSPVPTEGMKRGNKKCVDRLTLFLETVARDKGSCIKEDMNKSETKIARVMYRLFAYLFAMEPNVASTFEFPHQLSAEDGTIEPVTAIEYNCRLFMKRTTHPDSCRVVSGSRVGVPAGRALYQLNDRMTGEERALARRECALFMDADGFVSPAKLYVWFATGVAQAVAQLIEWDAMKCKAADNNRDTDTGDVRVHRDFADASVEARFPVVSITFPLEENSTADYSESWSDETEPEQRLTLNIIPTIRGKGWPTGTQLQHAFPRRPPYCWRGKTCLAQLHDRFADGQAMFYLELHRSPPWKTPSTLPRADMRLWTLSFLPAERLLWISLFDPELRSTFDVDKVVSILRTLRRAHAWDALSKHVIASTILWTVKRRLPEMTTLGDCVLLVLEALRGVAHARFCACFLMPNVNIAKGMRIDDSRRISLDIGLVLKKLRENAAYILTYIGYAGCDYEQTGAGRLSIASIGRTV